MKPAISLVLSIDDVNVLISLLRQAPMSWDISNPLLTKIDGQIKKAMEPAKAEPEEDKEPPSGTPWPAKQEQPV